MPSITVTEWLDELRRISQRNDEGLSMREWQEHLQVSTRVMRDTLRKVQAAGSLKTGFRVGYSIDGKAHKVPVYSVLLSKPSTKYDEEA